MLNLRYRIIHPKNPNQLRQLTVLTMSFYTIVLYVCVLQDYIMSVSVTVMVQRFDYKMFTRMR